MGREEDKNETEIVAVELQRFASEHVLAHFMSNEHDAKNQMIRRIATLRSNTILNHSSPKVFDCKI